ncbi:NTE family protein [Actinokineospora alba]|uniref:NTE family protein n=1 Tax=Actinokineospora alba TaxID=504798 RepID=A0A1H0TTU0_9PSEU|nr:patatin-like phospholipase family protein [Actinokineospora alba]TDP70712.1 NTE family protein [Actinokineospora alba]SDJ14340.1 NTE family protein [Actinokineospora alba]SDP57383.1 NTE family protein [Actinokineospora alba]
MRRGLVIGCGGTLGAAWTVGALVAVEEAFGWDPRTADVLLGTSAGAEFVTLLGSGVGVGELLDAHRGLPGVRDAVSRHLAAAPHRFPPLPHARFGSLKLARRRDAAGMTRLTGLLPVGSGHPAFLIDLVDALVPAGGWVKHPAAWVVGCDYDTGERVAFGSPTAPTASMKDAVCASWAVPGWFPPVEIDGRRFADGGIASPTSADLLLPLGLDEVVVLAPMASVDPGRPKGLRRVEQLVRTRMSRLVDAEVAALRAAGTKVLRLDPGPEDLAAMGPNFMDGRRAARVLETSLRTSRAAVRDRTVRKG